MPEREGFLLSGTAGGWESWLLRSTGGYGGGCADETWIAHCSGGHKDQLVRAIRAIQDAIRWTYELQNRDEAIAIMIDATKAPPEFARATLDLYVNQLRIWPPDADFEDAAMTAAIEVMGELNQLPAPLPPWTKYVDRTYVQRANAR